MRRLLAAVSLLVAGCSIGPVWTQRVDGRVLDRLTGKGVPGATVRAYHDVVVLFGHGAHARVAERRVRTDADGFFVLEGRFSFGLQVEGTGYFPELVVEHPEYDLGTWSTASGGRHAIEIQMQRQEDSFASAEYCHPGEADRCFWACYGDPSCVQRHLLQRR